MRGTNSVIEYDEVASRKILSALNAPQEKIGVIRVSALGGCLYHKAWKAGQALPPPSEEEEDEFTNPILMELGKAWEEYAVPKIATALGVELVPPPEGEEQHQARGDSYGLPMLKGSVDGIIVENGERKLLELKLQGAWPFRKLVRGEMAKAKTSTEPGLRNFPDYHLQVHMYMGLLELTECLFISTARQYREIEEYVPLPLVVVRVPFSAEEFNYGLGRAELLQHCFDTGNAPSCELGPYCPTG